MKKFLDILLIVLLTVLVINIFSDKGEVKLNNTLTFEFSDNDYTIPASILINVENNTAETVSFNTCNDIDIKSA
ncbi:hypothetical protein HOF65_07055 [bacterium]|jgi:hypothetical protein|nr:hypothetical protein [bacterium]MBT3853676.1 hypothetical protein [bacterium]MBT4633040.1 hypothetical protein [bacterium]